MGRGAIVIGLAAIIIGQVIFGKLFKNFALKLLAVSLGAIIYFVVIQAVLILFDVDSRYLKLFSAVIVAIFLTRSVLSTGLAAMMLLPHTSLLYMSAHMTYRSASE